MPSGPYELLLEIEVVRRNFWRVTHEINKQDLPAKVSIDLQSNVKRVAARFFFGRKSNKPLDGTNLINSSNDFGGLVYCNRKLLTCSSRTLFHFF